MYVFAVVVREVTFLYCVLWLFLYFALLGTLILVTGKSALIDLNEGNTKISITSCKFGASFS